jgi:hypothetical protein
MIIVLDYTKPHRVTSVVRDFKTDIDPVQIPLELNLFLTPGKEYVTEFVKCEFDQRQNNLPIHLFVVCKMRTTLVLFRVNLRALRNAHENGGNSSIAISYLPQFKASFDWDALSSIMTWGNHLWLPTLATNPSAVYLNPKSWTSPNSDDQQLVRTTRRAQTQPEESLETFESVTERARKCKPCVLSLKRAKLLFRETDKLNWPWDILHLFGVQSWPHLSNLPTRTNFQTLEELLEYCRRWVEYFGLAPLDAFVEHDVFKVVRGSYRIVVRFSGNETSPFQEPWLGCLAYTLRFLGGEQVDDRFRKLTSILFGSLELPRHLPVFALHPFTNTITSAPEPSQSSSSEEEYFDAISLPPEQITRDGDPAIYLSFATPKELLPPQKPYGNSSSNALCSKGLSPQSSSPSGPTPWVPPAIMLPKFSPLEIDLDKFPQFVHRKISLSNTKGLIDTQDWRGKLPSSPLILEMFVPRERCESTWYVKNGDLNKVAFGTATIPYPVCVPSLLMDTKWQVNKWSIGESDEHCLVLFVRQSQLKEMAEELGDRATFVIVPLEDEGAAHAFTRQIILEWALYFECPFIYLLDDNVSEIQTIDDSITGEITLHNWWDVFKMFSDHANSNGGEEVAVWGMMRSNGKNKNNNRVFPWAQRHCQCFVMLNIKILGSKNIRYRRKDAEDEFHQKKLGDKMQQFGPMEDYLLNFECEENGLKVLQNQYYAFKKAERPKNRKSNKAAI